MAQLDITRNNLAVERALDETSDPRRRFLLQAYHRHRYLEIAGRVEEIFAPEMMGEHPTYHVHAAGNEVTLRGQDAVRGRYRMWAETNQSIVYVETEEVAVADTFVASVALVHQQVWGGALGPGTVLSAGRRFEADDGAMYLYANTIEAISRYDHRGRLLGEDVWEPDPGRARITRLAPGDVLTTAQAAALLAPLVRPLPSFDEAVLGRVTAVAR
jgi:hypothetical protein